MRKKEYYFDKEPIPESIDENYIKKNIKKDVMYVMHDFENTFDKLKISKNKQSIEKCAKKFGNVISKVTGNYNKIRKHETLISRAIQDFTDCVIDFGDIKHKVKVKFKKDGALNASIYSNIWNYSSCFLSKNENKSSVCKRKTLEIVIHINYGLLYHLDPDEIIAILLHEFGHFYYHNIYYFYNLFYYLLKKVAYGIILYAFVRALYELYKDGKVDIKEYVKPTNIKTIIFTLIVILMFLFRQKSIKLHKRMEQMSDAYSSYMGYGRELASAFDKMNTVYKKKYEFSRDDEFLPLTKIRLILINITRHMLDGEEHEVMGVRICKALRITAMDPEIKKRKKLYNDLIEQYRFFNCNVTIRSLADLKL